MEHQFDDDEFGAGINTNEEINPTKSNSKESSKVNTTPT
jgi:hypothetical protein